MECRKYRNDNDLSFILIGHQPPGSGDSRVYSFSLLLYTYPAEIKKVLIGRGKLV